MYWFLYDNGLRHERVKRQPRKMVKHYMKQFIVKSRRIVLSVFDHFVGLGLKGLTTLVIQPFRINKKSSS